MLLNFCRCGHFYLAEIHFLSLFSRFGLYMGTFVQQTADSGYVVSGTYQANEVYIIKTNQSGDTLWTRHYINTGACIVAAIEQTTDGGYIVVSTNQTASK